MKFVDFDVNQLVVAPVIYGTNHHFTTNVGIELPGDVAKELRRFLSQFNKSVGAEMAAPPYYRIDAYFDESHLWILEINASFVDGWGTALNLARASGIPIDPAKLTFPKRFATVNQVYLPELELFVDELKALGVTGNRVVRWRENGKITKPTYVYGRTGTKGQRCIFPYDGIRLDNKIHLGLFNHGGEGQWSGYRVKIPYHYINRFQPWGKVPQEVILKFCDKGGEECERARRSVIINKPCGKAPFLKRCYRAETLLAQEIVCPTRRNGANCQLVILAIGDEPITGYVQYSEDIIITDDSVHGPLRIN